MTKTKNEIAGYVLKNKESGLYLKDWGRYLIYRVLTDAYWFTDKNVVFTLKDDLERQHFVSLQVVVVYARPIVRNRQYFRRPRTQKTEPLIGSYRV